MPYSTLEFRLITAASCLQLPYHADKLACAFAVSVEIVICNRYREAIDVFKSLHDLLPEDLNCYFKRCEHEINTRGNGSCVLLPKMCTETGEKSFAYQRAHIFNRLEKTARDEISIVLFKEKLKLSKSL